MEYFISGSTYFSKLDDSEDYISAIKALCDEDIGVINTKKIIEKIKEKYETYLSLYNMETIDNNILKAITKSYKDLEDDEYTLSHSINIINMVFDLIFPFILDRWLFDHSCSLEELSDMAADFLLNAYRRSVDILKSKIKKERANDKKSG